MKSKRFTAFLITFIGGCLLAAYGVNKGADLIALGTLIALVNTGSATYMIADTVRPSGAIPVGQTKKE